MSNSNNPLIWEDETFNIVTPLNPHLPYSEGLQLVLAPKESIAAAWEDPELAGRAFVLASKVCAVMLRLGFAPWFNIQANGNWGLIEGKSPFFHIHIYGRNKTSNWAKPIVLPVAPGTYKNNPMPESERVRLSDALRRELL